jgi:hypothetical protein
MCRLFCVIIKVIFNFTPLEIPAHGFFFCKDSEISFRSQHFLVLRIVYFSGNEVKFVVSLLLMDKVEILLN